MSLRYSDDSEPGYRRAGRGKRARYLDGRGARVTDPHELERIKRLAVPPAWTEVWINADPDGHLQAVGRDARGRKQYRYHPEWRRRRDGDKYRRTLLLARRLPRIREAVERDLARPGLPREKVLALVVRLLERTHLRVGGDAYARLNGSFGLTTLRDRQAKVEGSEVRFRFRGKGGKLHDVSFRDRRLAALIRRIQELPGQRLFEYSDEDGQRRNIRSDDVNEYLRDISGADVTAKDFRTWAGCLLAYRVLVEEGPSGVVRLDRSLLKGAIEQVAEALGNTAAVTRSSYVAPALIAAWHEGDLERTMGTGTDGHEVLSVSTPMEEAALLRLLERRG